MSTNTLGAIMKDSLINQGNQDVYIQGDKIVIRPFCSIELSECESSEHILAWAVQLCGKTWVTTDDIRNFINLACAHNKIEIPL